MKRIIFVLALILTTTFGWSQDNRTLDTKVADLLARMPVHNSNELNRQMNQMMDMQAEGRLLVLKKIIPAGLGDDTRARFAIESYSRFLSAYGHDKARQAWEDECISFISSSADIGIKAFFLSQLNYIGGSESVIFAKDLIGDKELCYPAVAVLASIKSKKSETILAEELLNPDCHCAATIMNVLASWKSDLAIDAYISWYKKADKFTQTAALNALAESGNTGAYATLAKAASTAGYKWEATGATAAFIQYARNRGDKGDLRQLEKISKQMLNKAAVQYKIASLEALVHYKSYEAYEYLISAFRDGDKEYRMAILELSYDIPGKALTRKWIELMPEVSEVCKIEIVSMLGMRGDLLATETIIKSLFSYSVNVRVMAASAIAKLLSTEAVPELIDYIRSYGSKQDQEAGYNALLTVTDSKRMDMIAGALDGSEDVTKISMIKLLGKSGENRFFDTVYKYTSSEDEKLKASAYSALKYLAEPHNQTQLLELLFNTSDTVGLQHLQIALATAANKTDDKESRADILLTALEKTKQKEKVLPVLSTVGGNRALQIVLKEFESGNAEMRQIAYLALCDWIDYNASYALYDICTSGNKTYSGRAFYGYVKQIAEAELPADQKLLLFRKIMPYALTPANKESILSELGKVRTLLSLLYTAEYLDDKDVQQIAARSVMSIALSASGSATVMYGDEIKKILEQTIQVLDGEESDYYKERIRKYLDGLSDDKGFVSMFNGKDLDGWQGLVENPLARSKMSKPELARKQKEADKKMTENWSAKDGAIWFSGKGANLCSVKHYGDFELYVDWRISKNGDSGIYLRGTPQVQIWDTSRVEVGAQVGSGGLYNNQKHMRKPLKVADNPIGDWNTFRIIMIGEKVSVWLNGELVVDDIVMENYWDRSQTIVPKDAIELQAHGNELAFRNIYVREINMDEYNLSAEEKTEGFVALFNGRNLDNWVGNRGAYVVEDAMIVVKPTKGSGGNLYTEKEYKDFNYRFEFQLTPGANNGLGIRTPLKGDAAYVGMELQILDNTADIYANLQAYQYHGSVYGVIPAKRGFLRPVGEWNEEEVIINGTHITIILNGTVIVDGDIAEARDNGTMDHKDHPGLKNEKGHIGFLGHGSVVKFRNIRIKELKD